MSRNRLIRTAVLSFGSMSLLAGCSSYSKEEAAALPTIVPRFSVEPEDWYSGQANFTYMRDPSKSDVTQFDRKEQFAVGMHEPVTHLRVKVVWLEGEALGKEQLSQFDDSDREITGSTLHQVTFYFRLNSSTLGATELRKLRDTVKQLEHTPHRILVVGRTDSTGPKEYNQRLSEQRAWAVRRNLVAYGANPDSIVLRAYGETRPVADNATKEGRAKNRSVSVRWIGTDEANK